MRLQKKAVRIINDIYIQDILPHTILILKFPDRVKLHTCLFLYDHIYDESSKFSFSFIPEQRNFATLSAYIELIVTDCSIPNQYPKILKMFN